VEECTWKKLESVVTINYRKQVNALGYSFNRQCWSSKNFPGFTRILRLWCACHEWPTIC